MFDAARATFVGNLAQDPRVNNGKKGSFVGLTVAVNPYKDAEKPYYFDITVNNELGENVADSFHKGDRVMVEASIWMREVDTGDEYPLHVPQFSANGVLPDLQFAKVKITKLTNSDRFVEEPDHKAPAKSRKAAPRDDYEDDEEEEAAPAPARRSRTSGGSQSTSRRASRPAQQTEDDDF